MLGARSAGSMSDAGPPPRSSCKLLNEPCVGGSSAKDAAAALPYASLSSTWQQAETNIYDRREQEFQKTALVTMSVRPYSKYGRSLHLDDEHGDVHKSDQQLHLYSSGTCTRGCLPFNPMFRHGESPHTLH